MMGPGAVPFAAAPPDPLVLSQVEKHRLSVKLTFLDFARNERMGSAHP
ncbi:hypothetical protein SPHINGOAX6_40003 [Sphingomonas sp. AX6]|nr:hypothetical protein SPHINGOAX6_40003 [Sphingomonas sp. AX6]